ncbi:MAG: PPC domain-containing DNA-binding protein [Thermoproteota archaeon]|nr:PPC domain-containing DNA-binding protein [Thermoproteota archaeon]
MGYVEFNPNSDMLVRVKHNSDLIQFITELAEKKGITAASFTAIGALKRAKLGFYDQQKHEYREITVNSPHEIASCIGNISLKNGKPFVHAHAVLADKDGTTKAGHLFEGIVFASEVHLNVLKGVKLERKYDEATNLSLWDIK